MCAYVSDVPAPYLVCLTSYCVRFLSPHGMVHTHEAQGERRQQPVSLSSCGTFQNLPWLGADATSIASNSKNSGDGHPGSICMEPTAWWGRPWGSCNWMLSLWVPCQMSLENKHRNLPCLAWPFVLDWSTSLALGMPSGFPTIPPFFTFPNLCLCLFLHLVIFQLFQAWVPGWLSMHGFSHAIMNYFVSLRPLVFQWCLSWYSQWQGTCTHEISTARLPKHDLNNSNTSWHPNIDRGWSQAINNC